MDELSEAFAGSQITAGQNSIAAPHPRYALYKAKISYSDIEARRRRFLDAQKNKRFDFAKHARQLATNEWDDDDEDESEGEDDDEMELDYVNPPRRSYKDQLMFSEWLVEAPTDLDKEWLLVLCPVGKRCLVVASRGCTKVYNKAGFQIKSFPSLLPGGTKSVAGFPIHKYTLLDCLFDLTSKTFYVLDLMCWNSHPNFDSETEFRFFWMHSKFEECKDLKESSKDNPYKFIPLPNFKCDPTSLAAALFAPLPFPAKLDGLLFYHKRTHYTCGLQTPLVGWLKGYMVPEILNIPIPQSLEKERPSNYKSLPEFAPEAFQKHTERKEQDETNMQYEDD